MYIVYTIHIYKCVYRILLYVACNSDKQTNVYTGKIKKNNKKISKNIVYIVAVLHGRVLELSTIGTGLISGQCHWTRIVMLYHIITRPIY